MAAMTRRGLFGALLGAAAAPKVAPVSHATLRNAVKAVLDNKAIVARMQAQWITSAVGAGLKTRAEVMRDLGVSQ